MVKFSDIPQFTKTPDYQINIGLKYLPEKVREDIEEMGLQLNPDFQRGHVWTEEQQIRYIEYLLRGGKSGRDLYFNCPGWRIGEIGNYVCVDGLQRLTAILKFMNNEIKAFGYYYNEFEGRMPLGLDVIWHVNDLKTKKEVLRWYVEMNSGGTPHTEEEIDRVKRMMIGEE